MPFLIKKLPFFFPFLFIYGMMYDYNQLEISLCQFSSQYFSNVKYDSHIAVCEYRLFQNFLTITGKINLIQILNFE